MGAAPAPHRFAHSADHRQFVGVGPRRNGRKRRGQSKSGLKGAAALASPTHLPSTDDEGEHGGAGVRRGEAGFRENVSGQTG